MPWNYRLSRIALVSGMAAASIVTPLATLAVQRAEAVSAGPTDYTTATYNLEAATGSILAAGSDPRLRVSVFGDLAKACRIAIVVPGVGHKPAEFDLAIPAPRSLPDMAKSLWEEGKSHVSESEAVQCPTSRDQEMLAVVAWLGYVPPPGGVEALSAGAIRPGAANLAALQSALAAHYPQARVTWMCHSFGSLVCASALVGADPDALVLLGSPGVMVGGVDQLPTSAPVFAARGPRDPIRLASALDLMGGGFGADPAAPDFGAERLRTGAEAGHGDYFLAGSAQLDALAQVATNGRSSGEADPTPGSQTTVQAAGGGSPARFNVGAS
jgi:hypothetical protein